jgi:hypothetical protein
MNLVQAILNVAKEARAERGSRTAMIRLERSLRAIGCDDDEVAQIMSWFDYWDSERFPYMDKDKAAR